jgi:hypothetical protein
MALGCRRGTGQRSRAPRDACGISYFVHEAGGIQPRAEASTTLVAPDSADHVQLASDGETRAPGGLTAGRSGLFPFDMMPGTGGAPHLHTRVSESFLRAVRQPTLFDGRWWVPSGPGSFVHVPEHSSDRLTSSWRLPAETHTTAVVDGSVDTRTTTSVPVVSTVSGMSSPTRTGLAIVRSVSTATKVNAFAMIVAIVAIVWQIAAGVDYPPVPPGIIILAVGAAVVLFVRAPWAPIVGIAVPLFLAIGATVATVVDDDNALRHVDDASPFAATVLQLVAVAVAFVAGVASFREQRG